MFPHRYHRHTEKSWQKKNVVLGVVSVWCMFVCVCRGCVGMVSDI